MSADVTEIVDWCAGEVERQQATPLHVAGMFRAWEYAQALDADRRPVIGFTLDEDILLRFESLVMLRDGRRTRPWRVTPAAFANGNLALAYQHIERQMGLWMVEWNRQVLSKNMADQLTKQFLMIHPFEDGNGRIAAILWNWRLGTLSHPKPLPEFFP